MGTKKVRFGGAALAFTLLASAALLSSCSGKKVQAPVKDAVPVEAAMVEEKAVPIRIQAIGNVEAYSTVGVKSQIGGELLRVHFKEGQDVRKGEILFTIDPRPYEAALRQAEANLAKDTAQLENAKVDVGRYAELVEKGYVARQQYDQVRTNFATLQATVNADKALVENARLQLKYCYIYSPITGRAGGLVVNQGNLIKANADNPIVTINQVQPIYVTFSVPEQSLADIKKYMAAGKLTVEAFIGGDTKDPERGVLTFVDNAVDAATGTIKLKGTFENKERRLWPGQFVNAVLTLTSQPDAVVVPADAVQAGQSGQYVFVIKQDLTVDSRPVEVSRSLDGESVIGKGVRPGEKVVTDGQLRLVPGAKVEIKNSTPSGKQ
ncbi:MAG: efflux RND transporter periplasmic adaptor subunit [Nitrospirae bacterium]|nr:efflux RND transporter periplasmic adaptor subunit [Nitrospirota bacterium]